MIEIVDTPIDVTKILQSVEDGRAGGHVHFIGTIREENGIEGIQYESYEKMALKMMEEIVDKAKNCWPIEKISVVHRVGWVPVGEAAVVVAVACGHRKEAFEACQFVIDTIKTDVPIWKVGNSRCCIPTLPPLNLRGGEEGICHITGVILAGGKSSRFGENKALISYQGQPLIQHVLKTLSSLFEKIMIVTNTPEDYEFLKTPIVKDLESYQGPLSGIFSAFRHTDHDDIFVVGCDMPDLNPQTILRIVETEPEADATIPVVENEPQYLMARYSRRLLSSMCRTLGEGRLSVKEFCGKASNIHWLALPGPSPVNINTPEDLKRWEAKHAV